MAVTRVAIVGLGTVGTGVARLLLEHPDRLSRRAGRKLSLVKAVVRDLAKPRSYTVPSELLTDRVEDVIDDPDIDVVAQLVGGLEPARSIMLSLLDKGKDVVTANKALLAEHGDELFERARQRGRSIAFEASVAGGIPIIANLSQCLTANRIESLDGILNGTSNFILSKMAEEGVDYSDAVAEAQRLGFAEADPTMDVDGTDAAQKLAILAQLGFGAHVAWHEIPRIGIDTLDVADVRFAREMGYEIKLLAIARRTADGVELHVSPTLVPCGTPMAGVRGAYNAVLVAGDAVGSVFFHGLGAGQLPTASAVVADLIDTVVGRSALTFRSLGLGDRDADAASGSNPVLLTDYALATGRFYLRVNVEDHPGVLAKIADILGRHQISIASVIQHEPAIGTDVIPLLIMTHETRHGHAQLATDEINQLSEVTGEVVRMWVRD